MKKKICVKKLTFLKFINSFLFALKQMTCLFQNRGRMKLLEFLIVYEISIIFCLLSIPFKKKIILNKLIFHISLYIHILIVLNLNLFTNFGNIICAICTLQYI